MSFRDHPDETPDPRSGYVVVGRLLLPRIVAEIVRREAHAHGQTSLGLVREVVAQWVLKEGHL